MALPFKKAGGGYLNGVAGVIVGYKLDSKTWEKKGQDPYTTISVELQIKQDGADGPVQQFLPAGFLYENQSITEDGLTLESEDDKPIVTEDSEFGKFLASAVEAGLDETSFVESNLRSFEGLVNQRFVFKREKNVELMEALKAKGGDGKRKGKDGKKYDFDLLLVQEYLGVVTPAKGKKATGKVTPTKTSAAAKGGKVNGAAKNADTEALIEQADGVLLSILADAGKAVDRTGLSAKIVRYSTENKFSDDAAEHNAIRESLRKLIGSEDFLNRENGWNFDPKAKGQPVSL